MKATAKGYSLTVDYCAFMLAIYMYGRVGNYTTYLVCGVWCVVCGVWCVVWAMKTPNFGHPKKTRRIIRVFGSCCAWSLFGVGALVCHFADSENLNFLSTFEVILLLFNVRIKSPALKFPSAVSNGSSPGCFSA